jgi:aminoglycoside 6-adenylyltransferase
MRTDKEIIDLIKNVAANDERIRAVLLTGSRAQPHHISDRFSDFDIMFIVHDISSFLGDHSWIDIFGERLVMQMPDDMTIPPAVKKDDSRFSYLMLFKDYNRIDLTIFSIGNIDSFKPESLTLVLSDKDGLFNELPAASNSDYLIGKPTRKEFTDCCNEFWWVCTYVAKGLWRGEITYAKDMLEKPVRAMFLTMLEWHAGIHTNFSVSAGKSGNRLSKYFDNSYWENIMATYPNAETNNIWASLFAMTEVFRKSAKRVAEQLGFAYNMEEDNNVTHYLEEVKAMKKRDG